MAQVIINSDTAAYIANATPATNFGTNVNLVIGSNVSGKSTLLYRSITDFELPLGITVQSTSKLELYINYVTTGGVQAWLYRCSQIWTELGATWNTYDGTNNWSSAGGDYTTPSMSYTVGTVVGTWDTLTGADLATYLQDAVDSRQGVARCFLKYNAETGANFVQYDSDDGTNKPKLTVDYTGTPTWLKRNYVKANIFISGTLTKDNFTKVNIGNYYEKGRVYNYYYANDGIYFSEANYPDTYSAFTQTEYVAVKISDDSWAVQDGAENKYAGFYFHSFAPISNIRWGITWEGKASGTGIITMEAHYHNFWWLHPENYAVSTTDTTINSVGWIKDQSYYPIDQSTLEIHARVICGVTSATFSTDFLRFNFYYDSWVKAYIYPGAVYFDNYVYANIRWFTYINSVKANLYIISTLKNNSVKASINQPGVIKTGISTTLALQYSNQRKVIRTSNGDLHCVYYRSDGSYRQIYYAKSTDDGDNWTETKLTSASYDQYYPSIAVDSNDYLHVVWEGRTSSSITNYQIRYIKYTDSWQTIEELTTDSNYSQGNSSIAVDSNDYLHVVWNGKTIAYVNYFQIRYLKYTDSWQTIEELTGTNTSQMNPSVAIDSNNYIHIVWRKVVGVYYQIAHIRNNGSWETEEVLTSGDYTQYHPSIAIDSNDYLHVVWLGTHLTSPTYEQIRYIKHTDSWQEIENLTSGNYYQGGSSIAIDSNDYLHVVWDGTYLTSPTYYQIRYIKYTDSWQTIENLTSAIVNQKNANLIWSYYPIKNGLKINRPSSGYAFIWSDDLTLRYLASDDLEWDIGYSNSVKANISEVSTTTSTTTTSKSTSTTRSTSTTKSTSTSSTTTSSSTSTTRSTSTSSTTTSSSTSTSKSTSTSSTTTSSSTSTTQSTSTSSTTTSSSISTTVSTSTSSTTTSSSTSMSKSTSTSSTTTSSSFSTTQSTSTSSTTTSSSTSTTKSTSTSSTTTSSSTSITQSTSTSSTTTSSSTSTTRSTSTSSTTISSSTSTTISTSTSSTTTSSSTSTTRSTSTSSTTASSSTSTTESTSTSSTTTSSSTSTTESTSTSSTTTSSSTSTTRSTSTSSTTTSSSTSITQSTSTSSTTTSSSTSTTKSTSTSSTTTSSSTSTTRSTSTSSTTTSSSTSTTKSTSTSSTTTSSSTSITKSTSTSSTTTSSSTSTTKSTSSSTSVSISTSTSSTTTSSSTSTTRSTSTSTTKSTSTSSTTTSSSSSTSTSTSITTTKSTSTSSTTTSSSTSTTRSTSTSSTTTSSSTSTTKSTSTSSTTTSSSTSTTRSTSSTQSTSTSTTKSTSTSSTTTSSSSSTTKSTSTSSTTTSSSTSTTCSTSTTRSTSTTTTQSTSTSSTTTSSSTTGSTSTSLSTTTTLALGRSYGYVFG